MGEVGLGGRRVDGAGGFGEGVEIEAVGVIAADDHGEGVFEAEGRLYFDVEALVVEAGDGVEHPVGGAVGLWGEGLFEDGGEGGAGVFDVGVDTAGDEGLVAEVGTGEVEAAFYGLGVALFCGDGFDLLGEEFAEDDLFGEVFGSDDDVVGAGWGAAGEEQEGNRWICRS